MRETSHTTPSTIHGEGFFRARRVVVNDIMQRGYEYERTEPMGANFEPEFQPDLTPPQALELGTLAAAT